MTTAPKSSASPETVNAVVIAGAAPCSANWCDHMLHDGTGWTLLGRKPRHTSEPRWQFCPICSKPRPIEYSPNDQAKHAGLVATRFMIEVYPHSPGFKAQDTETSRQAAQAVKPILKTDGVLVFKWNEDEVSVKEILKLTPVKPLFGSRYGRHYKSHWIVFMKSSVGCNRR